MTTAVLFILLSLLPDGINRIAQINRLKGEAEKAYGNHQYQEAAEKYRILIDSLGQDDEKLSLNLSHCYFNLKDTTKAYGNYKSLTASADQGIRSVASQQLGILNTLSGRYDEAVENFKDALRANPGNEDARYNYELLKKQMKEHQDQNQPQNKDENKDQQKDNKQQDQQKSEQSQDSEQQKDQQQKENQDQNSENKDAKKNEEQARQQESQSEDASREEQKQQTLKNEQNEVQKISEEKAKMILEAMRNSEEQYLQQMRRKATKRPDSGKPDW